MRPSMPDGIEDRICALYPRRERRGFTALRIKGPVFERNVEINCYPPEFILAEKLESIVFHGSRNSRMKDFHDLYKLTDRSVHLREDIGTIIESVFDHRGTELRLPIDFSEADSAPMQELWTRHVQGLRFEDGIPRSLSETVEQINGWLNRSTSLCSSL